MTFSFLVLPISLYNRHVFIDGVSVCLMTKYHGNYKWFPSVRHEGVWSRDIVPSFLTSALSRVNFYVLLVVHLNISLDNDHVDAHLRYFTIRPLQSSTCFEHYMLIIRRTKCIVAASGIVTLSQWPSGAQVERELLCSSFSTCATDGQWLRGRYQMLHQYSFNLLTMSM